eukprot:310692-Alexandrium_andersonii.AAC.1
MSASLVGSEMCIRDRQGEEQPVLGGAGDKIVDVRDHVLEHGDGPYEGAPVSYTHLTLPTICSV